MGLRNAYSFVFVIFTAPPLPKNKGGTSEPDVPPEMKSHVLQVFCMTIIHYFRSGIGSGFGWPNRITQPLG